MPPVPPVYDPEQMRAVNTSDIFQRQQPATLGTRIVAVMLVVGIIAWTTIVVTRSHHTSASPSTVSTPAVAPRSAAPGR